MIERPLTREVSLLEIYKYLIANIFYRKKDMALWGNNDAVVSIGTVSLDYSTRVVTGRDHFWNRRKWRRW